MKNLLKFEFRKLLKSKTFIICFIIEIVFSLLSILALKLSTLSEEIKALNIDIGGGLNCLKTSTGNFSTIAAIFLGIFISYDYSSGVIKNIYSKGYSRKDVFLSKFIAGLSGTFIIYFSNLIFSFAFGALVFWSIGTAGTHYVLSLLVLILLNIALATLFFSISIAIGRLGLALVSTLLLTGLFGSLLSIFDLIIYSGAKAPEGYRFYVGDLWLEKSMSNLMVINPYSMDILVGAIISVVYIAASIAISYSIVKKKDV